MDSESEGYLATADFIIPKRKTYFETKKNYHEIQTAAEMSNIFRVPLANISSSFRKKKLFFTSLVRSLLGKTVLSVLSSTLEHSFSFQYGPSG